MIHFLLMVIKWVLIMGFCGPVMFLFGVKVFDQWVAGDFHWDGWGKIKRG